MENISPSPDTVIKLRYAGIKQLRGALAEVRFDAAKHLSSIHKGTPTSRNLSLFVRTIH
jgi:hypothetical protein